VCSQSRRHGRAIPHCSLVYVFACLSLVALTRVSSCQRTRCPAEQARPRSQRTTLAPGLSESHRDTTCTHRVDVAPIIVSLESETIRLFQQRGRRRRNPTPSHRLPRCCITTTSRQLFFANSLNCFAPSPKSSSGMIKESTHSHVPVALSIASSRRCCSPSQKSQSPQGLITMPCLAHRSFSCQNRPTSRLADTIRENLGRVGCRALRFAWP